MFRKLRNIIFAFFIAFSAIIPLTNPKVSASSVDEKFFSSYTAGGTLLRDYFSDLNPESYGWRLYMVIPKNQTASYAARNVIYEMYDTKKNAAKVRNIAAIAEYINYVAYDMTGSREIKDLEKEYKKKAKPNEKWICLNIWIEPSVRREKNPQKVINEAKRIANSLNLSGLSVSGKVERINNWFLKNVKYDSAYKGFGTADEVILHHKGVCANIANAFKLIASFAGLDVRYIANSDHAWNLVLDGGKWKSVDITWNINDGNSAYTMVSSDSFERYHTPDAKYIDSCTLREYPIYGNRNNTGWKNVFGKWTYINSDYTLAKGWKKINYNGRNSWFYFDSYGTMQTGWKLIAGKWYYMNSKGVMLTGFQTLKDSQGTFKFYFNGNGQMLTGWQKISGKWYYLSSKGHMLTGWQTIYYKGNKEKFYLNANGSMQTGWKKLSNKWYFFDKTSGVMKRWWIKDGGKWYYLNGSGVMLTGWQKIKYKGRYQWFYLKPSGDMVTGWQSIKGKKYYFNSSGVMLTGKQKIGNRTYTFNADGSLKK